MAWIIMGWAEILQLFISFWNKKRLYFSPVRYQNILIENPAYHMHCIKHLPQRKMPILSAW